MRIIANDRRRNFGLETKTTDCRATQSVIFFASRVSTFAQGNASDSSAEFLKMKIYFMGICGTAMGNAALIARDAGHEVLGADTGTYPPMSNVLANEGIAVHEGYDPARLEKLAPDLVVIGNAMSRGHPEVEW